MRTLLQLGSYGYELDAQIDYVSVYFNLESNTELHLNLVHLQGRRQGGADGAAPPPPHTKRKEREEKRETKRERKKKEKRGIK